MGRRLESRVASILVIVRVLAAAIAVIDFQNMAQAQRQRADYKTGFS